MGIIKKQDRTAKTTAQGKFHDQTKLAGRMEKLNG
jgi:hypothetical protein